MSEPLYIHGIDVTHQDSAEVHILVKNILQPIHEESGIPLLFAVRDDKRHASTKVYGRKTRLIFATTHNNMKTVDAQLAPLDIKSTQVFSGEVSAYKINLNNTECDPLIAAIEVGNLCKERNILCHASEKEISILFQTTPNDIMELSGAIQQIPYLQKANDVIITDMKSNEIYCTRPLTGPTGTQDKKDIL